MDIWDILDIFLHTPMAPSGIIAFNAAVLGGGCRPFCSGSQLPQFPTYVACWRSDRTLGVWCQESRNMRIFVQIPDLKNFEELFGLRWTTMTPEDQHTESAGAILPVSVLRVPTQFHSAPSRSISTCLWSCDRTTTTSLCPNPVC